MRIGTTLTVATYVIKKVLDILYQYIMLLKIITFLWLGSGENLTRLVPSPTYVPNRILYT